MPKTNNCMQVNKLWGVLQGKKGKDTQEGCNF